LVKEEQKITETNNKIFEINETPVKMNLRGKLWLIICKIESLKE
jgi:hypothetical protein